MQATLMFVAVHQHARNRRHAHGGGGEDSPFFGCPSPRSFVAKRTQPSRDTRQTVGLPGTGSRSDPRVCSQGNCRQGSGLPSRAGRPSTAHRRSFRKFDLQVSAARSDEPLGRRVFQIHVAVNGRFIKTVDATADVAAVQEVVVPVRPIKMDEQIEADDVTTDRIVLFDLKQPYITNPADVIGKAAIRPLAAQSAIRITAVRRPFAVHKGDRVMIEARQGNLSIQTVGVTKSHGEMGQTITVSNVDSGKELRATVVAPGVVRVTF